MKPNSIFFIIAGLYMGGTMIITLHKAPWSIALGILTTITFATYTILGILKENRLEMKKMEARFQKIRSPQFRSVGRTGILGIELKEHV